jgi:hypothetical protein
MSRVNFQNATPAIPRLINGGASLSHRQSVTETWDDLLDSRQLLHPSFTCRNDWISMPFTGIKKQKTFSHRRHIARPRAFLGSEKEKRQSSLTQLDFVSTPQNNQIISISDDNDEDGDFEVEQPRKRRRVSANGSEGDERTPRTRSSGKRQSAKAKKRDGLEKGQQTMTQIDFVPSAQRRQTFDDIEDDDDLDHEHNYIDRKSPVSLHQVGVTRTLTCSALSDDQMEHVPQSPFKITRRKTSPKAVDQQSDLALHSIAAHDFTTPKKEVRHPEIPSSQSPPSIKMSTRQSRRSQRHYLGQKSPSKPPSNSPLKLKGLRRTPLIEKSVNIAPQRWQPKTQESQNPTMKMLQQVRLRTRMGGALLHEEAPMPPPKRRPQRRVEVESSQANVPTAIEQVPPRRLQRTTTVQDSQASDENITTQMPPRGLTRSLTVQDSQHEDLDLSSQLYRSMSSRENLQVIDSQAGNDRYEDEEEHDQEAEEEHEEGEEEDYPHTYDPVSAALERDAARYAWTQTQALQTQHKRTQIMDSEEDSDDDDLDRGISIIPDSESEDEMILLPSDTAKLGISQELCSENLVAPNSAAKEKTPQPLATLQKQTSTSPPSSPPPLRPSQVSTVMPTQSSLHFTLLAELAEAEEYSPPTSPPTATKQAMIEKPKYQDTQAFTISSSPLPVPPWSSSGEVDLGIYTLPKGDKTDNGVNELASLVDYSLPPPPPLGMSSSPWR